jgi:hypothetical protein
MAVTDISDFGSTIRTPRVLVNDSTYSVGEVPLKLSFTPMLGDGAAALATAEINGSGVADFWITASGDEFDTLFRVPGDYDGTQAAAIDIYYAIASSSIATNDTVTPLLAYQVPSINSSATLLADATVVTGVTNPGSRTLATATAVGKLYKDTFTLASTFAVSAGDMVHANIETKTTCNEAELRLYSKAVFRYARAFV